MALSQRVRSKEEGNKAKEKDIRGAVNRRNERQTSRSQENEANHGTSCDAK